MNLLNKIKHKLKSVDKKSIQLIKNSTVSFIIKGMGLVISLLTMPAYIRFFNNQTILGVWFTAISILSWILIFDLGVGNGLRNHLVEPIINNNVKEVKKYISSAYISVGVIVIVILLPINLVLNFIDWNIIFNIPNDVISKQNLVFVVRMLFFGIMIQFFFKLITSIFYALQKSALPGMLMLCSNILILIYVCVAGNNDIIYNLKSLSIVYIVTNNLPYIIATIIIFTTKMRGCTPSLRCFDFNYAIKIIKLGGTFFWLQIMTMMMFSTNEFLITWLISPDKVVIFQIYNKLFALISTFFNLGLTPVWSAVTEACVRKDYNWIRRLYKKLDKILLILMPCELILCFLLQYIVNLWLGKNSTEISMNYALIFAIYNILFMKVSIDSSMVAGLGNLKIQVISLTSSVIVKFIAVYIFAQISETWISIVIANILALIPYIFIEFFDIKNQLKKL